MEINWKQTEKQSLAWGYLTDSTTTDILFGGGAGGAKSFLGCAWVIIMCGLYPGTRWLIGRKKLKSLKETTLNTFFDVCSMWGIRPGVDCVYNGQENIITFSNGSEVLLKDLFQYPSDPNFDSLGSLEITGAFLDEVNQLVYKAVEIVRSRVRYRLDEYRLIPKMFMGCNPSKNWVHMEYYKPWREGTLAPGRMFIQALATDNPFISKHYIAQLKSIKDKATRERLLFGNWEYDDDPSAMFPFDIIGDLFTTKTEKSEDKYISGDISRKGKDNFPVGYWEGTQLKEVQCIPYEVRSSTASSAKWISDFADRKGVRRSHIVLDEDGVGGGVVDNIPGCVGFVNNSSPIQPAELQWDKEAKKVNYANLKSQCYFLLADLAEQGKIGIDEVSDEIRNAIIEELGEIKQKNIDRDGPLAVIGKDEIKESLGRSPDYADMIMMRMYFNLDKKTQPKIRII